MPTCRTCGKEFEIGDATGVLYCSKRCREEYTRTQRRAYNIAYQKKYRELFCPKAPEHEKICEICGTAFRTKYGQTKYCSDACRARAAEEARKRHEEKSRQRLNRWKEKMLAAENAWKAAQGAPREEPPAPVPPAPEPEEIRVPEGPMELRACAFCGEPFDPADGDSRGDYCSERCERRAAERDARRRELDRLQRERKGFAPMVGCRWCGERIEVPDGIKPEVCPVCGKCDFQWLRRCHDCGAVVEDGSYRCEECRAKRRRRHPGVDSDGYSVMI